MPSKGNAEKKKDPNEASSRTGTFKGNQMVVEEGKEENKSKVKRTTVTEETFSPSGIVMDASLEKQPAPGHGQQRVAPSWP